VKSKILKKKEILSTAKEISKNYSWMSFIQIIFFAILSNWNKFYQAFLTKLNIISDYFQKYVTQARSLRKKWFMKLLNIQKKHFFNTNKYLRALMRSSWRNFCKKKKSFTFRKIKLFQFVNILTTFSVSKCKKV
jgi:hypothetical protein